MQGTSNKSPRTVVLGVDAMDRRLVERWALDGHLRFLANMLATCPVVTLSTPSRAMQGSVWPSILTGTSPGRHGLYLQTQLESGTYDLVRRRAIRGPLKKFYHYLGEAGLRCGVADIPTDAPSPQFPGLQIVDWATEFNFWGFATEPRGLAREIDSIVGKYPIAHDRKSGDSQSSHMVLGRLLAEGIRRKSELAQYLLGRSDLDLVFLVFMEAHKAGHFLWKYFDTEHPDYEISPPELRDGLLTCYQQLDRELEVLAGRLGPNDNLLVFSDHGMQAAFRGNHLAEPILETLGLLVREGRRRERHDVVTRGSSDDVGTPRSQWNARLRRFTPGILKPMLRKLLNLPRIDWTRTQAFVLPTDRNTYIRLNLKGREPEGQVKAGIEYERLLDRIEREFRALMNAATGRPAVSDVMRLHALYPGERAHDLPDIAILWSAEAPIDAVVSSAVGLISGPIRELRSGNHREEGFLLARGPAFRSGSGRSTGDVLQIAPTLLQLHGVEIPSQFERGPLTSVLERESRRSG